MGNPVDYGYATTDDINLNIDIDLDKLLSKHSDLEKVLPAIERGLHLGIEELVIRLKDKMLQYLIEYGLGDSDLAKNILVIPYGNGVSISVGSDYAIYVEYGTGLAGSQHPHPKPTNWQ